MKKNLVFLAMLASLLASGLLLVTCGDDPSPNPGPGTGNSSVVGTWVHETMLGWIIFTNTGFEVFVFGQSAGKGTYTVSGNNITLTTTALGPGSKGDQKVGDISVWTLQGTTTIKDDKDEVWTKGSIPF